MVDQSFRAPSPPPLWPRPEQIEPYYLYERRRRRHRLLVSGAVVLALLVVVAAAFLVLNARGDYLDGKRALAAGDYDLAIRSLDSAKIAGFPYPNAHGLLAQAVALANGQAQYDTYLTVTPTAATRDLRRAAALFQAGRYNAALTQVRGLSSSRVPPVVARALTARSNGAVAALLLLAGAEQAFAAREWGVAGSSAADVLVSYPRCGVAAALAAEAGRRGRAEPIALQAASLAAAGRWTAARAAVRRALLIDPAYPGAAALLARIDAAIAHNKALATKRAAAAAAAAAARLANASTSTTTTTPPAPATKPTPPPP